MMENIGKLIDDGIAAAIITEDLKKRINEGEKPIVPGFVAGILDENNCGVVYLFNNAGVMGRLFSSKWRKGGTWFFGAVCKKNRTYDFNVIGYKDNITFDGEKMVVFELSREDLKEINENL